MTTQMFLTPVQERTNYTFNSGNLIYSVFRDISLIGDVRIRIETFAPDVGGTVILTYSFSGGGGGQTTMTGIGKWEVGFHHDSWDNSSIVSITVEVVGTATLQISGIIVDQGEDLPPWWVE